MLEPQLTIPNFTAHWCWPVKHLLHPWNTYVYFRRVVNLPAIPRQALVHVSADSRYTLFVNGQRLHHGPARFFTDRPSFDTLDLAPLLRTGVNSLCAVVHQFGIPTFFGQYRDQAGFFLDGQIEDVSISTPTDWVCRVSTAWKKETARRSVQMGFQEHYDADADPAGWMSPDFVADEKAGWKKPGYTPPAGSHPWLYFEPRIVPLLTDHVEDFAAVAGSFYGKSGRGYKITSDVYHFPQGETRKKDAGSQITDVKAMLADDATVTTVAPPSDSEFVAVTLDLKTYRTGHVMLDISEAAGDEIIDILYAERLDDKGFSFMTAPGPGGSSVASGDRYRCRSGAQQWETFHYIGFQYVTLIFRNIKQPLKVRYVGVRQVHTALEPAGTFECSDKVLNQVWQTCRTTQLNCAFDGFVDCPWREQAQWWGDARVQAKVVLHAFGDTSLLERGIRQVRQSQGPDGSLHSHPPSDCPHHLPDFALTWIESVWDFYQYTGRIDTVAECLPTALRVMEFFRKHEVRDGLLDKFPGFWLFLDWAELFKGNASSVFNMYYLRTCRTMAKLCKLVNDHNGDIFEAKALELARTIERYFWDDKTHQWLEGFDFDTREPKLKLSQHATTLAILLGLQPEHHQTLARDVLIKASMGKRSDVIMASSFFHAYVLEALNQLGLQKYTVTIIRRLWGQMLDKGATAFWEDFDGNNSRCHAWSASPLYHLTEQLLGVQRVAPGWQRVRIAPIPCGLDFARGQVPTPFGLIKVEWENVGDDQLAVRVDLPEGIEAEFISPSSGDTRALFPGSQEFSA